MLLQSLQDFSYTPIMSFLSGVFVDLGTHHIESASLETFHTSSYQSIEIGKLCLGNLWFTGERFLEFTYGSTLNHFLLFVSIYQSLQIVTKSLETFHKWPNQYHFSKKHSLDRLWYTLLVFAEIPGFQLCTHHDLSLLCLCWFGNSSYWIRITWNFAHITVSVYRDKKTMFVQLVIQWTEVPGVHLWFQL